MNGFDFIGNIVSELFDTDYVDIRRDVAGKLSEIYSNVSCHAAYASVDNPDPNTVDVRPVIQSLTVHFPPYVDVQNNDYLVVKKMGSGGKVLAVYSGRCGNPIASQGRKKVAMQMNAVNAEEPTPAPEPSEPIANPVQITVSYVDTDGESVKGGEVVKVAANSAFAMDAPQIDGWANHGAIVDGEHIADSTVKIVDVGREPHIVLFVYAADLAHNYLRFLDNGLYTQNDGSMAKGWHLYGKEPLDALFKNIDGTWGGRCRNVDLVHKDNGDEFKVVVGARLVLFPHRDFVEVVSATVVGDSVDFIAAPYEASAAEKAAYVAEYYD